MRRRGRVIGAVVKVVGLVAVVGVGAVIVQGRVALPTAPPVTEAALRAPFAKGVLSAEADSGRSQDRAAVRAAALQVLDDEAQLFVIDARHRHDPPDRLLAALTSPAAERSRLQLLRRSRSEQLARTLDQAVDFFLREDFRPNPPRPAESDVWGSGAFHLDAWQGVQVAGNIARVIVRGEEQGTSWQGRAQRRTWEQDQLLFERSASAAHGWRLVREVGATTGV